MVYVLIAVSITTIILISGLVTMAIGGKINKKLSSKLMSIRVIAQALSILCLLAYFFLKVKSS